MNNIKMTSQSHIDIVALIEKNATTRLNHTYQSTLINKIKGSFTADEQQLFVASFYCYLNYDSKRDFIIDFTDVWKWCGFTRKGHAKTLLEKFFTENIDYKNFASAIAEASLEPKKHGGQNKEHILLTVNCFKKFCMKADTKKADQIHEYYIKLEELLQETLKEQTDELQLQLQQKEAETKEQQKTIEQKEQQIRKLQRETQVVDGKNVVYLCTTDEKEVEGIYTVGKAINLKNRLSSYNGNKLFNFKIVKYISCKSIKLMDAIEQILLGKFNKYKIISKRDVFQLPQGKEVYYFTQWYDYLNKFCEDIEDDVVVEDRTEEELKELADEKFEESKEAKSEYNKDYRQEHQDEILDRERVFRDTNRGYLQERQADYRESHREEIIERKAKYASEHKEEIADRMKTYREENKEKIAASKKKYNEEHKAQNEEKIKCVCGSSVSRQNMSYHLNTDRHKTFLETGKTMDDQRKQEFIKCICGISVAKRGIKRHEESKIHKNFLALSTATK